MDLRPSPEQDQLIEAFAALYAKESPPERVRAAEPLGFDATTWGRVLDTGALAMAVGEEHGGWGASLLDLELIAEQQGRAVAPVPVIEAQVAARLMAAVGAMPELDGSRIVTLGLHPAVDGVARLVPAAAIADAAVIVSGDALLLVPLDGCRTPVDNLGSQPLADVRVGDGVVELGPAGEAFETALDEWMTLTAGALVGMAERALELAVAYVKERRAWGQPIGSFQAVAHRLADAATAVDGARLLVREAAWAASDEPQRASELAAMAFAFVYEAARDTTYWSLHFHGGYGFMMEYDVQLYYRRVRGWANVLAEPRAIYRRVADRRYG